MAYQTGTSSGNIQMATYDFNDGIGVAGGSIKNQTLLAANLKPPKMPNFDFENVIKIGAALGGFVLGVIIDILIYKMVDVVFGNEGMAMIVFCVVALFLPGITAFLGLYLAKKSVDAGIEEKHKKHERELARWSKMWICLSCGNGWLPRNR